MARENILNVLMICQMCGALGTPLKQYVGGEGDEDLVSSLIYRGVALSEMEKALAYQAYKTTFSRNNFSSQDNKRSSFNSRGRGIGDSVLGRRTIKIEEQEPVQYQGDQSQTMDQPGSDEIDDYSYSQDIFYEPHWLDTSQYGNFGQKVKKFTTRTKSEAMERISRPPTVSPVLPPAQNFPKTYIRQPTETTTNLFSTTQKPEKSKPKGVLKRKRVKGLPKPSTKFTELSNRVLDEEVVLVDGIPIKQKDINKVSKKSVFTLGNLLTPDIWKKGVISIFKQNNKQNNQQKLQNSNQKKFEERPKVEKTSATLSSTLMNGMKNGYNNILTNFRSIFDPVTSRKSSQNLPKSRKTNSQSNQKNPLPFASLNPSNIFNSILNKTPRFRSGVHNDVVQFVQDTAKKLPKIKTRKSSEKSKAHRISVEKSPAPHSHSMSANLAPPPQNEKKSVAIRKSELDKNRQSDIQLKEDFFTEEMNKFRSVFPNSIKLDRRGERRSSAKDDDIYESRRRRLNWLKTNSREKLRSLSSSVGSNRSGEWTDYRTGDWRRHQSVERKRKQWTDLLADQSSRS